MRCLSVQLVCLLAIGFAHCGPPQPVPFEMDPEDNDDEKQFEEDFNLPAVTDPEEMAKREEALAKHEEEVKEENEEFIEGKTTWKDAINEFSDLPLDEFEAEKTGNLKPEFGRGLIEPTGADRVDAASERYFEEFKSAMKDGLKGFDVPKRYDSPSLGLTSSVKNQKQCGSCVAFANMAAIETCFKKTTGVFGDYSEQQLVDCGYEKNGASGCNGAYSYSYIKTVAETSLGLTAEANYPYKNQQPALTCPTVPLYNQGAKVTGVLYTYKGNEKLLKGLVAQHGAVVSSVRAAGPFQDYAGGVFSGCTSNATDHAITVVGYGKEKGVKFWKIKNSWGSGWGENGFIKLERGVGMCGIGTTLVVAKCAAVAGPTDAPITTQAPCEDVYGNCPSLATKYCYQAWCNTKCQKSCGLCPGGTPAASNTCYDKYSNCADLCDYPEYADRDCKKACGKC